MEQLTWYHAEEVAAPRGIYKNSLVAFQGGFVFIAATYTAVRNGVFLAVPADQIRRQINVTGKTVV